MDWSEHFKRVSEEYFDRYPDRWWDALKFGFDERDIFAVLAPRFNTTTLPLLDDDAFCRDVAHISMIAQDRDQFLRLLQERRNMRHEEPKKIFFQGLRQIRWEASSVPSHHTHDLAFLAYYNSFDAIARFFANYLPKEQQWKPCTSFQPAEHPTQNPQVLRADSPTPSFVTAPSPDPEPSSPTDPAAPLLQHAELHELQETARQTRRTSIPPRRPATQARRGRTEGAFRSPSRVQKRPRGRRRSSPRHQESPNTRAGEQTGAHSPATAAPITTTTTTTTTSWQEKRKRDKQEEEDHNQRRPGIKRRKRDTPGLTPPPPAQGTTISGQKRKREQQDEYEDKDDSSQQLPTAGGQECSGVKKKRRTGITTTNTNTPPAGTTISAGAAISGGGERRVPDKAQASIWGKTAGRKRARPAATKAGRAPTNGGKLPKSRPKAHDQPPAGNKQSSPSARDPAVVSRVTRAQRRRLSLGDDIQLFHLGQNGEAEEVQGATHPHH
ncbi:hypothetical protein DHEL01_v206494 [Diaporthe helianthi]|uniref:Uncharacterized protein n=1 Tax=Diaporthe helianthi TaxID=158607 RepID=A0A2P5HXZ5_DIAHE|nr:hypothetical protein DHEL01_v206494 [Diaporthe helianthi]